MKSKALSSWKIWKPRRIYFRRFSTPSFPFCTVPKTEKSELLFWHFDQTLRYLIRLRGFHLRVISLESGGFWVQCKMKNSELKMFSTSSQTSTLAPLKFFRHLLACTLSPAPPLNKITYFSFILGVAGIKQNFSRSPIIWVFYALGT